MVIMGIKIIFSGVLLLYFFVFPIYILIQKGNLDSPFTKLDVTDIKKRKTAIIVTLVAGVFIFFLSLYMNGFLPSDFLVEFNNSYWSVYILIFMASIIDLRNYRKREIEQVPYRIFVLICTILLALTSIILLTTSIITYYA
jgi:succinate dehydrogenase hydrophobic anchor subunit